jgi:hypothetical protein
MEQSMRRKRTTRAAAAIATSAMLAGAVAASAASAASLEQAPPAVSIIENAKGNAAFSPTSITMYLSSPYGCNFTVTNTTASGHLIGYGVDRFSFKRAFYLAPGGSAGWSIGEPMTSYLKITDSTAGILAAHCKR